MIKKINKILSTEQKLVLFEDVNPSDAINLSTFDTIGQA